MNVCRALNSGWPLQIQADATYGICAEAVGLLGFGVNSLGAHIHLVGMAIIPESESKHMYRRTWTAIREALHSLLTNFVFCPIHGCQCCEAVRAVKEDLYTREMLESSRLSSCSRTIALLHLWTFWNCWIVWSVIITSSVWVPLGRRSSCTNAPVLRTTSTGYVNMDCLFQ